MMDIRHPCNLPAPIVQYLAQLQPDHIVDQTDDMKWTLRPLPEGTNHYYAVLVKRGTLCEDVMAYHIFELNGRIEAYCKNAHYIDYEELRRKLTGVETNT